MRVERFDGGSPATPAGGAAAPGDPAAAAGFAERAALPSMQRRARRGRTLTLIVLGAALVVSALGLWGVAVLLIG